MLWVLCSQTHFAGHFKPEHTLVKGMGTHPLEEMVQCKLLVS